MTHLAKANRAKSQPQQESATSQARIRVVAGFNPDPREDTLLSSDNHKLVQDCHAYSDIDLEQGVLSRKARQARPHPSRPPVQNQIHQPTQPPEFRAANRSDSVHFRNIDTATNAIAHVESKKKRNNQAEADYFTRQRTQGVADGDANGQCFTQHIVPRPNRAWAAQEANSIVISNEEAKIYKGINYERKQTGPFEGKLVSRGTIVCIEGHDYVEYRVLAKVI